VKLKIVSDGYGPMGTRLIDAETGRDLSADFHCTRVEIDVNEPFVTATLTCVRLPFEITCDARIEQTLIYDPDDNDSLDQAIALLQARRAERDAR
jgi:hypothetical protein